MDEKGHESGHLMLITPERVFYAGLLGHPRAGANRRAIGLRTHVADCDSKLHRDSSGGVTDT